MGLERQKASVLNDWGDFNHMLLEKERMKKKITSENQFTEQRPECSLVAGSKRKRGQVKEWKQRNRVLSRFWVSELKVGAQRRDKEKGGRIRPPSPKSARVFNLYLFLPISSINLMNIIFMSVPTLSSFPGLSFTKWLLRVGGWCSICRASKNVKEAVRDRRSGGVGHAQVSLMAALGSAPLFWLVC